MSWEVTEEFFETQEIKLDVFTTQTLQNLEQTLCNIIKQRLEKINLLIKDMNVFYYDDCLIINDRYKICSELEKVAKAFGFVIKEVKCGLRGSTYIMTDPLIELFHQIGVNSGVLGVAANQTINQEIVDLVDKTLLKQPDEELLAMMKNIRANGQYVDKKTRHVSVTHDGGWVLSRSEGAWDVDEQALKSRLTKFAENVEERVSATNKEMVAGTTQLIHYRARQMGYAVEEKRNGKEVQLVLVRLS